MEETQQGKAEYKKMVEKASPNSKIFSNSIKAFFVGGTICCIGQAMNNWYLSKGLTQDFASLYTTISLVFIGVLLTGLGIYQVLGKFAGAGSLVPITGFANSVAAPTIEFKREGYILGVGGKMFTIAGPVLLYGTLASVIVGICYFFVNYGFN